MASIRQQRLGMPVDRRRACVAGCSTAMKLVILGNSGSGKSSLARAVAERHAVSRLDLDEIVWEPGRVAVQRAIDAVHADLDAFLGANGSWVIEGCYAELVERALSKDPRLIFLNPGIDACLRNNRQREWEPHKYSSIEEQDRMLPFLQSWVAEYATREDECSYSAHRRVFDGYGGDRIEVVQWRPRLEDLGLG